MRKKKICSKIFPKAVDKRKYVRYNANKCTKHMFVFLQIHARDQSNDSDFTGRLPGRTFLQKTAFNERKE